MALYGGQRDVSLIRSLNRELIHRIIDTEVLVYKLNLSDTDMNIYDESDSKMYDAPVLIPCLANVDPQQWITEDFGTDLTQIASFAFLRDDLVDVNHVIEIGDVFEYRSRFFEVDGIEENANFVGKHPDNWFGGSSHGYSISIICQAHMTRQSRLNIVKTRFGNSISMKDNILPPNL